MNPLQQQFPNLMGQRGAAAAPQDPSMATPAEIQELKNFIPMIEQKLQRADAIRGASEDSKNASKEQALTLLFEELQKMGVDLTDQESVATFLKSLEDYSPEVAQAFQTVLSYFIGEDSGTPEQGAPLNVPPVDTTLPVQSTDTVPPSPPAVEDPEAPMPEYM